jgi:hypothetical protein
MSRLVAAATCVLVALSASAQYPIGHPTPSGGYAPSLFAEPLWLGNTGFSYRIEGAPPGGSAIVAVSLQRQDQVIGGLQIYPDLSNLFVTHLGSVDGAGNASFPVPLGSPDVPGLAGLLAYAQAAVTDPAAPGTLASTQGLMLEILLHPMFALGNNTNSVALVDAVTGTRVMVSGVSGNLNAMVSANGGADLFLASSDGIRVVDTTAAAPSAVLLLSGPHDGLAWDRVHRRLYALAIYSGALRVIDGDRGSPTFGAVIAQTALGGSESALTVSADGTLLALRLLDGQLQRRNADPSSPGYLIEIPTPVTDILFTFGTSFGRLHLSPDGRVATLPVTQQLQTVPGYGTSFHRFDSVLDQWIDHDPATPGVQPLSSANHAGLPVFAQVFPTRDGSSMLLIGSPLSARLGLDLDDPTNVSVTSIAVPPISFGNDYVDLSPSGRFLVRRAFALFGGGTSTDLSLVEIATGGVTNWVTVPMPGSSGPPPATWR